MQDGGKPRASATRRENKARMLVPRLHAPHASRCRLQKTPRRSQRAIEAPCRTRQTRVTHCFQRYNYRMTASQGMCAMTDKLFSILNRKQPGPGHCRFAELAMNYLHGS